jgi:hypothetical protein
MQTDWLRPGKIILSLLRQRKRKPPLRFSRERIAEISFLHTIPSVRVEYVETILLLKIPSTNSD